MPRRPPLSAPRTVLRARWASAASLGVVLALCACSGSPTAITPPEPVGAAATACRSLDPNLPTTVDGESTAAVAPESPFTAAWGDIVLTCGAPAPTVPPDAQLLTVQDVDWYPEDLPQGGTRFSTVQRLATVTVVVPATHRPEANALVDLGPPIATYVPLTQPDGSGQS